MFKSKKADATVTVLVLMTLLLCSYSLVLFYVSEGRSAGGLTTALDINDFYLESNNLGFFMKDLAQDIISSEGGSISAGEFIELFKAEFTEKAKTLLILEQYQGRVESGDFSETKIEDGRLYFNLQGFSFSKEIEGLSREETIKLNYLRNFKFELNLR